MGVGSGRTLFNLGNWFGFAPLIFNSVKRTQGVSIKYSNILFTVSIQIFVTFLEDFFLFPSLLFV